MQHCPNCSEGAARDDATGRGRWRRDRPSLRSRSLAAQSHSISTLFADRRIDRMTVLAHNGIAVWLAAKRLRQDFSYGLARSRRTRCH